MPHKFDNSAPSDKALKKEAQAKGMGVPQSTGKTADMNTFKEAAVIHDAPDGPADISALKNPHGAGTDSAVGGAAPTGTLDIAGAPTSNIPSELRQT